MALRCGLPSGYTLRVPAVATAPGATAFTRIPCAAASTAAVWVRFSTAALAAP